MTTQRLPALTASLLVACTGSDKEPTPPPLVSGKADVLATEFVFAGALAADAPVDAALTATESYLGFTFHARSGDEVALETRGSPHLDTVLFVYGPFRNGSWGAPLAHSDDHGGSLLSRVDGLDLAADGQYLAIVQSYQNRHTGPLSLALSCSGCSAAPRPGDVIVSEVLAAPDVASDLNGDGRADAGDRFVELRNVAPVPVAPGGLTLTATGAGGDARAVHTVASDALLGPGQALVVFAGPPTGDEGFGGSVVETASGAFDALAAGTELTVIDGAGVLDQVTVPDSGEGSLVRVDPADPALADHLDVTDGLRAASPGLGLDGSPFPSPNTSTQLSLGGPLVEPLRRAAERALFTRFGVDLEIAVSTWVFLGPKVGDKQVIAALGGFADVLGELRHPDVDALTSLRFATVDSERREVEGGGVSVRLDLRDDPRSYLAFLSAAPEDEPALAALRAEADARFADDLPAIAALEPGVADFVRQLAADPGADPRGALEAAAPVKVTSVERKTRRYGDEEQYREDSIDIALAGGWPDALRIKVRFHAASDEVREVAVTYRETSQPLLAQTLRTAIFEPDGSVDRADSRIHDETTGRLLYRTWEDGLGNVHRRVEVNPPIVPRAELPSDDSRGVDHLLADLREGRSGRVVVGIFDSGIDYNHPALAHRLLENDAEGFTADGADDDGNGRVDDVLGWDFDDGDRLPFDYNDYLLNIAQSFDHGTHVAGIASRGTDDLALLPARFKVEREALADGARYLTDRGARVVNMSFGSKSTAYRDLGDVIAATPDVLFVAAAGNDGADIDVEDYFPAGFPHDNLLVVAAVDGTGALTDWSNFGAGNVDVAAPGDKIFDTVVGGGYGEKSGTSMATPYVANVAAKMLLLDPSLTPIEIKSILMRTGNARSDFAGKVASGAVIDADRALRVVYLRAAEPMTTAAAAQRLGVPEPEAARLRELAGSI